MESNYKTYEDDFDGLEGQELYEARLNQKEPEVLAQWRKEQDELKKKLIQADDPVLKDIKYIGGVDISFDKSDSKIGISALVICDAKSISPVANTSPMNAFASSQPISRKKKKKY